MLLRVEGSGHKTKEIMKAQAKMRAEMQAKLIGKTMIKAEAKQCR